VDFGRQPATPAGNTNNDQSAIVRRRLLWRARLIRVEDWQSNEKKIVNTRGALDKAYTDVPRTFSICFNRQLRPVRQPLKTPSVLARTRKLPLPFMRRRCTAAAEFFRRR
jgi:hypothetical protein